MNKHKHRLRHLRKLQKVERGQHHPLIHQIHTKHKISKKTLFYVKEYGPHSHVPQTIIRESLKILLFASVLSSLGGLVLEQIKTVFVAVMPLIILMPVLNDQIGGYGTIIASRFSTLLHEEKIRKKPYIPELKELLGHILVVSLITTVLATVSAVIISYFSDFPFSPLVAGKVFLIALLSSLTMILLLFFLGVGAGRYFYRKKEDPNNFLIPLLTAVADFANMIILALLVLAFF